MATREAGTEVAFTTWWQVLSFRSSCILQKVSVLCTVKFCLSFWSSEARTVPKMRSKRFEKLPLLFHWVDEITLKGRCAAHWKA